MRQDMVLEWLIDELKFLAMDKLCSFCIPSVIPGACFSQWRWYPIPDRCYCCVPEHHS